MRESNHCNWHHKLRQNQSMTADEMRRYLLGQGKGNDAGCWEWTGRASTRGYGRIKWQQREFRVHRLVAHLWLGMSLSDERLVCHRCDNPRCFNPAHLFIGTPKDNQQDCVSKGRNFHQKKQHCKQGHVFAPENTWRDKYGRRHCRTCHRETQLKRYRRLTSCA